MVKAGFCRREFQKSECSEDHPFAKRKKNNHNEGMFLRRIRRKKSKSNYDYWALVESVRTERGPRQRVVATIGKHLGLKKEERVGWEEVARILNGKPKAEADLFKEEEDIPQ